MHLNPSQRIAEVKGRSGTVRVVQKARRNSRVIPVDLNTGQDTGTSELVASDHLLNIRYYAAPDEPQALPEISRTIRIPNRLHDRLARLSHPFETPADVIERLLPTEDTEL